MNEQLKFSWGHFIAFMGLIILSYITFVGVAYQTDGNFTRATFTMVATDIVLFTFFMGAQMAKASSKKFAKRIWIERFFVFGSPVIFIIALLPFFHFGTVQSQNKEIVDNFTEAISASKQMFTDYESYSTERISNYNTMLDNILWGSKDGDYLECGFTEGKEEIQKSNMVKALRLQLVSENYDSLKTEALKWIDASSNGASTWNVFLIGNTKEIKAAINEWHTQLSDFASHKMTNEELRGNAVKTFGEASGSLYAVNSGLDGLGERFTKSAFPPIWTFFVALLLYGALMFPYVLQDRHSKSRQRLLRIQQSTSSYSDMDRKTSPQGGILRHKPRHRTQQDANEFRNFDSNDDDHRPTRSRKNTSNNDTDDFVPFTM